MALPRGAITCCITIVKLSSVDSYRTVVGHLNYGIRLQRNALFAYAKHNNGLRPIYKIEYLKRSFQRETTRSRLGNSDQSEKRTLTHRFE